MTKKKRVLTPEQKERKNAAQRRWWHGLKSSTPGTITATRRNDQYHAHRTAKYYITKRCPDALVPWADEAKIRDIYRTCAQENERNAERGIEERMEVDHIVPLINDLVCGIHVEYNLRVITSLANKTKNCYTFDEDDNVDLLIFKTRKEPCRCDMCAGPI